MIKNNENSDHLEDGYYDRDVVDGVQENARKDLALFFKKNNEQVFYVGK